LRIATWNINSVRLRQELVLRLIDEFAPDILCLQETKCPDELFPRQPFEDKGYANIALAGMKGYNGVAILSRQPIEAVATGFGDGGDDSEARVIAGTIDGVRVVSVYVVNGRRIDSDKYAFKLEWLNRLQRYVEREDLSAPLAICGDYNIAPDERDVEKVDAWAGGVLFNEDQAIQYASRRLLSSMIHIAKDMKIQVEFNPTYVHAYRLLGYENRLVADTDFRDDTVDGGEVGAGHRGRQHECDPECRGGAGSSPHPVLRRGV